MATPKQQYYEALSDSLIDKFNLRGIEGYYCSTKEEALLTAKRFLTPGCSVSWIIRYMTALLPPLRKNALPCTQILSAATIIS